MEKKNTFAGINIKKMKQILLIGLLLIATIHVAGQTQNIDSLLNVLETQKLTSKKQLDIYVKIGNWAVIQDDARRLLFAEKGLELAKKEKDKLRMVEFYNLHGHYYLGIGEHDSALKYFQATLDLAIEIKNKEWEAKACGNLGVVYSNMGDIKSTIEQYKKAILCLESDGKEEETALWLANIGAQYRLLGEYNLATQYLKKAENLAEKTNDQRALFRVYPALGNLYGTLKELDNALMYGMKALQISQELQSKSGMANAYQTLTNVTLDKQQFDKAEHYANECLRLAQESNNKRQLIIAYNALTEVYTEQGRFENAIYTANKVLEIDSTNLNMAANALKKNAIAYIHLGNKEKAKEYLIKFALIMDEINKKNVRENLMEMEVKYETEKKETRIASLEKERRLYLWLGAACGLLLLSMGLVSIQTIRNARKERQLVAAKAVQDGEMGERARIAEDLHDRLGGSLAAVKIQLRNADSLQTVSEKLDECIKEIREITHNLMPRSLRQFGLKTALEDFSVQFPNVHFHFFGEEKRIKERLEFIVYCCANELVTNSLRYSNAENINMQLIQSEKFVSLTVQDDGCGFDEKNITSGIGLKNIRDRVASCNGKLDIVSSAGKGTETIIELKVDK